MQKTQPVLASALYVARMALEKPWVAPICFSIEKAAILLNRTEKAKKRQRRRDKRAAAHREKFHHCLEFNEVFSFDNMYKAARDCEKGVNWKQTVISFLWLRSYKVYMLHEQILDGTYEKKKQKKFTINERGKKRIISPPSISDRIVQRCLCDNSLVELLSSGFVAGNSASLKGKGTEYARDRFASDLRSGYNRYGSDCVVLVYDFEDFFGSIPSRKAYDMVCEEYMALCHEGNVQDEENYRRMCKMLECFLCDEEHLGLGNQTSQIVAVYYISSIDHYIADACGFGLSGRYMDDGYAVCPNKKIAKALLDKIRKRASDLGLSLNENKCRIVSIEDEQVLLKTVWWFPKKDTLRRRPKAALLRRYRRHYRNLLEQYNGGKIDFDTLVNSRASLYGMADRCDNADEIKRYINRYCPLPKARR